MNVEEIIFITTTRYTPWLEYCQKSIKKLFPFNKHIIIDGTKNWPMIWYEWLNHLNGYKYFIMLDEDCFLLNRDNVIESLEKMISKNATISGVHDCYFSWRGFNEVCINPFYMTGDVEKVMEALKLPNWQFLKFNEKYFKNAIYDWDIKDRQRIGSDYEIFYNFFYAILESGQKISYLYPFEDYSLANQDYKLPATIPRISPKSGDIALHMWYSRQWNDSQNLIRYQKLEKVLKGFDI